MPYLYLWLGSKGPKISVGYLALLVPMARFKRSEGICRVFGPTCQYGIVSKGPKASVGYSGVSGSIGKNRSPGRPQNPRFEAKKGPKTSQLVE